jgi:hypothetical protein
MTIIPHKQLCQAFDPMMTLPSKTYKIIDDAKLANTSCVAPAFVFLEGSRGKRYLCDYHYYYEKDITVCRTPNLWPEIEKFIIDEREEIKKTFDVNTTSTETVNNFCWCKNNAYVKTIHKKMGNILFYCNFHFRKTYYRHYSNGIIFEDCFKIIDERYRMTISIAEESDQIKMV